MDHVDLAHNGRGRSRLTFHQQNTPALENRSIMNLLNPLQKPLLTFLLASRVPQQILWRIMILAVDLIGQQMPTI